MSPTELVLPVRQHLVLRRRANAHDSGRGSTATFLVGSGSSSGCIEDNTKGSRGMGWGVDVRKDVVEGGNSRWEGCTRRTRAGVFAIPMWCSEAGKGIGPAPT